MDLSRLQQQLQQPNLAPVERWDPPFCGDLPIVIDSEANWHYQGSKINRPALVKLFASVLLKQGADYFLQTPAEKVRIQVADAAFMVTDYHWQATAQGPALLLTTNIEQTVLVSPQYPLLLQASPQQQLLPYLQLWRGLSAKLSRTVYYQLAEQTTPVFCNGRQHYQLKNAGYSFTFAII